MMASLVLLVPIVVFVTAAPFQQILDDRLIGQSKDTLPVSPEVGVGSVKVDSKKPSRKQTTKVNGDSKETKTSQVLFQNPNQDDQLSTLLRTFPVLPENSLPSLKKTSKKQPANDSNRESTSIIKSQSDATIKLQNGAGQLQTGIKEFQTGTKKLQPGTNKLQNGTKSSTERPVSRTKSTTQENQSQELDIKDKVMKKGRKHKAFFLSYPFVPQIHHHYPNLPDYDLNFEDCDFETEERTPGGKKKYQDSNIYYIRLPPTPYMFVPGLGYISQPPRYSTPPLNPHITHIRPIRPARPPTIYQPHVNPFIKLPIDFISNGKPTSVYQWPSQDGKPSRPQNHITNLEKGPYVFNGRPSSIYLLRPDGSQTVPEPIRYNNYQDNGYY